MQEILIMFHFDNTWVERFNVHGSGLKSANGLISIGMMPQEFYFVTLRHKQFGMFTIENCIDLINSCT